MSKGKLKINGKRLKDIIAITGHTQKEIDEYFGFPGAIDHYITRGEIPVSIKDALEYHFAINYEDYAKSDSGCRCCNENNLKLLGWLYCPICGRDFTGITDEDHI